MGTININYTDPAGNEKMTSESEVIQQMMDTGSNVVGISPDGMSVIGMTSDGQQRTVPIQQVMETYGHKVNSISPTNPDESMVNPAWRMAVGSLNDPDAQKSFLEAKLRREGLTNPQVHGKDGEWYNFNPATGRWSSLTNKSGMDMSDMAGIVPGAVKGIAGGLGAALGAGGGAIAGLGVGSIPGAMAGGALGSGAAEAGMQGLMSLDPDYRAQVTGAQLARNIGGEALAGGVGAGVIGGAAKFGGPLLRTMATSGPVSSIARGFGKAGEVLGSGVKQVGRFFGGGPIRQDIGAGLAIPGAPTAQLASLGMQAPKYLAEEAPKLMSKLAGTNAAKSLLGEGGASTLAEESTRLLTPRGVADPILNLNRAMRGQEGKATARDILGNLAETASDKLGWRQIAKGGEDMTEEQLANIMSRGARWGKGGEIVGQGVENLGRAGQAVEDVVRGAGKVGARITEGVGAAGQGAGSALHKLGLLGQPFEPIIAAQRGMGYAEESLIPHPKHLRRPVRRETIFANN